MKKTKLKLNRETIAMLTKDQLRLAAGGISITGSIVGTQTCVNCDTTTNIFTHCRCVTTVDSRNCP